MKEITRIHLARTPFNTELDAKKELEKYLTAIEKTLAADDDTLREIEARIIELLGERGISGEKVITVEDVRKIKEQLGAPAEFADEQGPADIDMEAEKRLMRDSEKGVLGGVLAGIGAYTGIDTLWLRLGAIVLAFLSFGTAVFIYVVLWMVMPRATTAADKLRMTGKPVTLMALKEQSQVVTQGISEKTKPFVVVLRVLLGIGFIAMAVGALALVVVGGSIMGVRMSHEVFSIVDTWLVVAFILTLISGILFATLCGMLAYASFAWRFSKSMAFGVAAVIIAGLVTFSGAVGFGIYGGKVTEQKVQEMTHIEKVQMSDLEDVKKLVVNSKNVPIEYRVASGSPYAEMQVVSFKDKKLQWSLERKGSTATLLIEDFEDTACDGQVWYSRLCIENASVVIYGPALESLESATGQVAYVAMNQPSLSVIAQEGTTVTLTGGAIDTVRANIADDSELNAESVAIARGDVRIGRNSVVTAGVLAELTLETPDSCALNSKSSVSIERVSVLKKSGKTVDQAEEMDENCTVITIDDPYRQMVN